MRSHHLRHVRRPVLLSLLGLAVSCSHGEQTRHAQSGPPLPPLKVNPFAGLDPLGADSEQTFRFRPGPKPPPTTTKTIKLRFPVAQAEALQKTKAASPPPGPLKVLRTQPKGEDRLIGAVTADFNQPMVPVASLADLKQQHAPLRISPSVPGRFRWLGTQTVAFEPEGRMPYATHFVATIPAGTRSAVGGVLDREVRFEFSTPRPALVAAMPWRWSTQARPDTAIALQFNQRVNTRQLLELISLSGRRGKDFEVVPRSRWDKLPDIGHQVAMWDPERTIALQPRRPLAKAAPQHLSIAAGLEGEGPRRSTSAITHIFSTYGPLRVHEIRCGDYERCNPASGFIVYFTNPLRAAELDKLVEIKPVPANLQVEGGGSWAYLRGDFDAQTSYAIHVRKSAGKDKLVDIHDQELSAEAQRSLRTGNYSPDLRFPVQGLAALELRGKRQIPLEVQNVGSTRLRLVQVDPAQIFDVIEKARSSWDDGGKRDPLKGIKGLKVTRTLLTGIKPNGKGKIAISTDEALGAGGAGAVYVELRSNELRKENRWANPFRGIVVQVTDIGIMARYDNDRIVALLTHLDSGAPLPGALVELRDRPGKVIWSGRSDGKGLVRAPGRRPLGKRSPFSLWVRAGVDRAFVLLDQTGDDGNSLYTYSNYSPIPPKRSLAMHLFTDRSPYRPGEKVQLKGVLRIENTLPDGGIEPLPAGMREIEYRVTTSRGQKLVEEKAKLSPSGAFAVTVAIPDGADLGAYSVQVKPKAGPYAKEWVSGSFQVEEYRPPEFAVKVEVQEEPYFFGDRLQAQVGADYLFGAPMSGAQCNWTLSRAEGSFVAPGNAGFSFGDPLPWRFGWQLQRSMRRHREGMRMGYSLVQQTGEGEVIDSGQSTLDATGRVKVSSKLQPDPEAKRIGPASFTLEAQVTDQNRQSIANRKVIVVHPASRYVGLRADKTVVRAGELITAQAVLVDLKGQRIAGQALTVEAVQVQTKVRTVYEEGHWIYKFEDKEKVVGSCAIKTANEPKSCELKLPLPGGYKLRAGTADDKQRKTRTSLQVYAFGPGYVPWNLQNQSQLELVPDKAEYRPGDVARVLVKSPLQNAIGLLTVLRGGLDRAEALSLPGTAQVVEIPIKSTHLPEVHVAVSVARGRLTDKSLGKAAQDLGRPTFAHGTVRLPVVVDEKRVKLEVKPAREVVAPAEKLPIKLRATDSAGKPVRGEIAVMVVDEGVLSLLGFTTPDPLAFFFHSRGAGAPLADLRNALLGKQEGLKPEKRTSVRYRRVGNREARADAKAEASEHGVLGLLASGRGGGGVGGPLTRAPAKPGAPMSAAPRPEPTAGDDKGGALDETKTSLEAAGQAPARIRSRSLFATTAYYNPAVLTDDKGLAEITVPMPDNLTTYRIMAVALDRGVADRFGSAETQVKVRKPLLLRPSLPRFLSTGDVFDAAVMVHNETEKPGMVDVLVRGRQVKPEGPTRVQVAIDPHRAKEVRFRLRQDGPGPVRIQFAAVLDKDTDAVEKQLPVLLPVTTEAFATYGMTDGSVAQPVVPPRNALPDYGGLEVSMASTALNGLEDAVSYLVDYPHECTEQTASRVLPIFSLGSILRDFRIAKLKELEQQKRLATSGVRKLIAYQRYDGGWGSWQGSTISWPYISAYATFALLRAKEAGHDVPKYNFDRARSFLKYRLDNPLRQFGEQYDYIGQTASVWVLSELKQHEQAHLSRLYSLRKRWLPMYAQAWLMVALHRAEGRSARVKEILRDLNNAAVQTAAAAHFAEAKSESLRMLMHSDDFTDAVVLQALLEVDPQHPLMPKIARGLLDSRVRGRWSTTHANAFALAALSRYYKDVENVEPEFVSQIWYGEGYMGEGTFKGREMKVVQQDVPLSALRKLGEQKLILAKQGPGKLYYRIGLRYAPTDMKLPPEEQGFSVSRVYEPIADPRTGKVQKGTVRQRKDGTWEIKAGATVRVRLVVVVPDRRYFVAIADPLPAGLEGVNLSFATSARSALSGQLDNRTYDSWYTAFGWYSLLAFDHREMRDDRVVLFADRLPAGVYEYTYLARATTYGRFVVAPVKAEEMYHPETFGRSATAFVEVK